MRLAAFARALTPLRAAACAAAVSGCVAPPTSGPAGSAGPAGAPVPSTSTAKGSVPFEELTLQNLLINRPPRRDYMEAVGSAVAPPGLSDPEARRRAAMEGAVVRARVALARQLEPLVPREALKELLMMAELSATDCAEGGACRVTLRVPKDEVDSRRPFR